MGGGGSNTSTDGDSWVAVVLPSLISAIDGDGRARYGAEASSGSSDRTEFHSRPEGGSELIAEAVTSASAALVAIAKAAPRNLAFLIALGAVVLGLPVVRWWRRRGAAEDGVAFWRRSKN